MSDNSNSISLNKYISSTGICSRREADTWIDAGRVKINDTVAVKGNRVEEGDQVTIDDKPLISKPDPVYILLNKPPGVTCTTDLKDPDNIIDYINHPERIFPVGRLDKFSIGLILLTNDGDIVNKILRVENSHEKEYVVTVDKPVTPEFIEKMGKGVPVLGKMTRYCKVEEISTYMFRIILTQGFNRQIRRMCEYFDYHVTRLKRVRIMHLDIGNIRVGQWRNLTPEELTSLEEQLEGARK